MLNNLNTSETTIAEHKVSGVLPSYSKKQITELFMKAKQQLKDGTLVAPSVRKVPQLYSPCGE